ncbi:cytochrome ubiquinol oxidase subunit I [Campylobacter coli]|nr:cytochrome ubiquinol oxidase subunit I [Campylobacter coli]EFY4366430.1 cytochrome ubiquinol oxidase subunit I [Campylobacter coli]EGN8279201.1 cytochrome ubiquinol oxidase subunit I [Campylobacter coli]EGO3029117.1 cytochrome ubiquinol oxidase subunit I [Campylobacter coli]EHC0783193.1 cytochrome ubiquinol oxidase subunit I [Campylobacter coli]
MSELSSVDWSRAQFALTALYHFLFVPLTLGLSFIIAIMETIYVKTGNERWKKITKFWLSLFAINFAIGVATGIIMEFEFGTNWANYSWFVGDIFGAPLAVEGIMAFFLEATFFAVMFFGWDKVSKKFHLISTWCVAIGSNLSAFWILVANGWMQYPVGMSFNPDTARNEMQSFFEVALSPVAISKFLHIFLFFSGDESAYRVTQTQPMKLAAMEGVYQGEHRAGLVPFGILNPKKTIDNNESVFLFDITIPYALSILGNRDPNSFVPGIEDLIHGNEDRGIEPMQERIDKGKIAIQALKDYKLAKDNNDTAAMATHKSILEANFKDFGYGYLEKPTDAIPPVALTFYSFHIMVALGSLFFLLFIATLYLTMANDIEKFRKILWLCLLCIPLGYIAAEAGWIVAEVGRQPWAIQDLMPVHIAATELGKVNVQISFWIFAVLFTALLIAEIKIMLTQIKKGFDAYAGHSTLMGKGEK